MTIRWQQQDTGTLALCCYLVVFWIFTAQMHQVHKKISERNAWQRIIPYFLRCLMPEVRHHKICKQIAFNGMYQWGNKFTKPALRLIYAHHLTWRVNWMTDAYTKLPCLRMHCSANNQEQLEEHFIYQSIVLNNSYVYWKICTGYP